MRNDLTDITLIVDRSGSMQSCRSDAEGGINTFIEEQKTADGDAVFTLVQFDTEYEFVHNAVPIDNITQYKLVPRGMTALLDAVGRAINEVGDRLEKVGEEERPACVIVVIVTDGHENSSHEFSKSQIKEMIERQQSDYNWKFMFLGADQEAFSDAAAMGISLSSTLVYDVNNVRTAYKAASSGVLKCRDAASRGVSMSCGFTDEERVSVQ